MRDHLMHRMLAGGLAALVGLAVCASASAQKKEPQFVAASVVSMEKAKTGKNYTMKIKATADETEYEFLVTPKTSLSVTTNGDVGFFRPGMLVSGSLLSNQMQLSGKEFTIHLTGGPNLQLQPKQGQNDVFEGVGKIVSSDETGFVANFGNSNQPVRFEPGMTIKVSGSDPELVTEGAECEVEGLVTKAGKLTPSKIVVRTTTDVKAEEYLGAAKAPKTAKTKTAPATKKKKEEAIETADPFGLKKKEGEKKETDKKDGEKKAD